MHKKYIELFKELAHATTISAEQLARHERFVQIFRAAKKRKRDWQERMEILLSQREDNVQQRRQELLALVND